jgi:2-polyprenyl-3-methyl-5-hydroxy-6-metoxy-1,4-benzoquinol methylase
VVDLQQHSDGDSLPDIHHAALQSSNPVAGLSWLDIGCGRGQVLRLVRNRWSPTQLRGVDVIDWLDEDLRPDVEVFIDSVENALPRLEPSDRVLLIETLEHLEAPWAALRRIAHLVRPGGRLVITTPNVQSLRHRLDLLVRGRLTSFRADNLPHLTPCLPHVISRLLAAEGLTVAPPAFVSADIIPLTGGRHWPASLHQRNTELLSVALLIVADRPT